MYLDAARIPQLRQISLARVDTYLLAWDEGCDKPMRNSRLFKCTAVDLRADLCLLTSRSRGGVSTAICAQNFANSGGHLYLDTAKIPTLRKMRLARVDTYLRARDDR